MLHAIPCARQHSSMWGMGAWISTVSGQQVGSVVTNTFFFVDLNDVILEFIYCWCCIADVCLYSSKHYRFIMKQFVPYKNSMLQ